MRIASNGGLHCHLNWMSQQYNCIIRWDFWECMASSSQLRWLRYPCSHLGYDRRNHLGSFAAAFQDPTFLLFEFFCFCDKKKSNRMSQILIRYRNKYYFPILFWYKNNLFWIYWIDMHIDTKIYKKILSIFCNKIYNTHT